MRVHTLWARGCYRASFRSGCGFGVLAADHFCTYFSVVCVLSHSVWEIYLMCNDWLLGVQKHATKSRRYDIQINQPRKKY